MRQECWVRGTQYIRLCGTHLSLAVGLSRYRSTFFENHVYGGLADVLVVDKVYTPFRAVEGGGGGTIQLQVLNFLAAAFRSLPTSLLKCELDPIVMAGTKTVRQNEDTS